MAQEQGKTKITDLQHLITLTSSDNMSMHHLKVSRGLYDHHYILLGHKWEDEACEIIHYTVNTDLNVIGKGIAKKEMLSREQLKADIEKELYIINNDAYPRNSEAIATAWSRWRGREGETRYYVSASNCENLVTYILTGVSQSEQWNLAGFFKRALGDSIDVLICEWLETLLKGCASILVSPLLRRHSKKFATEINEKLKARNWASRAAVRFINIFRQSPMTRVPKFLKNFVEGFRKQHGIKTEEIYHIDRFMYEISVQFLILGVKTVGYSFLFSIILEFISFLSIIKFREDKKRGLITNPVYKRELVKRMIAMMCASGGTVLGCLLGFLFTTSLWNGPSVLGFLGNILFRLLGSVTAGAVVDWVRIG